MATARTKPRLSRRKRLLFSAILLVAGLGLIELACLIGLKLIGPYQTLELVQERQLLQTVPASSMRHEVMHPYLGWVLNPEQNGGEDFEGRHYPVNELGLLDTHSPLQKRAANKVIVGVIGGSVAWQASAGGHEALLRELRRQPRFQGREVILVRLAMNGYKQPQQLLLLTYLLSLGAELDVLVNIDGYNEVALHPAENGLHEIFPAYPRAWKPRVQLLTDPKILDVVSRYMSSKSRRQQWAGFCDKLPCGRSCTVNFLWKTRDNAITRGMHDDLNALMQSRIGHSYQVTGPRTTFENPDAMTRYLVNYWQICSRQMDLICQANGIEYHHVLPPNQHLLDSKPMSPQEREVALMPSMYSDAAQRAYTLLVSQGAELKMSGVQFHDLSKLFKKHPEPIYVDDCCHYNPAGNEMLATEISRIVGQHPAARRGQK